MWRCWNEMKPSLYWTVSIGESQVLQSKHVCKVFFVFFFIFNLVLENEFGARLPALDTETLFISWMGITWLDSLTVPALASMPQSWWEEETSHLIMGRMKDILKTVQSLTSGLFSPGLWDHLLLKGHITWQKNRNSMHSSIYSEWGLSLHVFKHMGSGQPTFFF